MHGPLCRYLRWIIGLVDSDTLPLNVSREMLQMHSSLKTIKKKLVRKALDMIRKIADSQTEVLAAPCLTPPVSTNSASLNLLSQHAPSLVVSTCPVECATVARYMLQLASSGMEARQRACS